MKILKKIYKPFLIISILFILLTAWTNYKIENSTKDFIKNDIKELPFCKTALLLGTSKTLKYKQPNAYYYKRIQATVELYLSKKIKYIIVSGDNNKEIYNE